MNTGNIIREGTKQIIVALCAGLALASAMSGCSSMGPAMVRQGDIVSMNYTCRLKNGQVALTTREETAKDTAAHARIFLPLKQYGPEDVVAGGPNPYPLFGKLKIFEREAPALIARQIAGMKVGENRTVVIKAETPSGLSPEDRYTTLYRRDRIEKTQKTSLEEVTAMLGHTPVKGEKAFSYQGVTGTVASVNGREAVIHLEVTDGREVDMPFGMGIIRDYPGDYYEIVTDAKVGTLVRSMSQVGRIVSVDGEKFVVDYGNAFGEEELLCDVCVESILHGARDRDASKTREAAQ